MMNATLVIPQLDKRSFWKDSRYLLLYSILRYVLYPFPNLSSHWVGCVNSVFSDVFDELHFIESLKGDIRIVNELPKNLEGIPRARKHFTSWAGVGYYTDMTRLWSDYQVLKLFLYDFNFSWFSFLEWLHCKVF